MLIFVAAFTVVVIVLQLKMPAEIDGMNMQALPWAVFAFYMIFMLMASVKAI